MLNVARAWLLTLLYPMLAKFLLAYDSEASYLNSVNVSYDPLREDWLHLNYDSETFVCTYYPKLCNNFLDGIGCATANRSVIGCNPTLDRFAGVCKCTGVPVYYDMGSRIAKEIVDNRIKPEVGWMLEPWASGPPYSVEATYPAICAKLLKRIGCPDANQTIAVGSNDGKVPYSCNCGSFNAGSVRVQELICDQINNAPLAIYTIFADPFTFSVEFSIAIVLFVGKIGALIATAMYLPPIIGFLLTGVLIQDIISPSLIKGAGGDGPHAKPFGEIRVFALIIVLMRAGLTAKPQELISRGYMTVVLSILPYFGEFGAMLGYGRHVFGWDLTDIGLMVSIIAVLSPSLVIPGMIRMVQDKVGYTPRTVLISAPIEVVLAIILYGIFASLEQQGTSTQYPWVKTLPLYANILLIPVNILFSAILGFIAGMVILKYIEFRESNANHPEINRILPKGIGEYTFAAITTCYTLYAVCVNYYIPQTSGVLAVFAMTVTMTGYGDPKIIEDIRIALAGLWIFLEVFLFTTTGINLSFKSKTGPTQSDRGVNSQQVTNLIAMFFIGSLGRAAGILITGLMGLATAMPHRQNARYLFAWWIATWTFQWPKATVQATLGVLPYQNHVIPGAEGLTRGLFILQASAFSVLVQAPIGVALTAFVGKPLALYLRELDRAAGEATDEFVLDAATPVPSLSPTAGGFGYDTIGMGKNLDEPEAIGGGNSSTTAVGQDSPVPVSGGMIEMTIAKSEVDQETSV